MGRILITFDRSCGIKRKADRHKPRIVDRDVAREMEIFGLDKSRADNEESNRNDHKKDRRAVNKMCKMLDDNRPSDDRRIIKKANFVSILLHINCRFQKFQKEINTSVIERAIMSIPEAFHHLLYRSKYRAQKVTPSLSPDLETWDMKT
jgi:hypothetical protein